MLFPIHVSNMKDAEHLSHVCRNYPEEILLRSDKYCVDPKSALGILAIMYSAGSGLYLDTGNMSDESIAHLIVDLNEILVDTRTEKAS